MDSGIPAHQNLFVGIIGTIGSWGLLNFNAVMGGIAATLTAGCMLLRFLREWRALKAERAKCRDCRERQLRKSE